MTPFSVSLSSVAIKQSSVRDSLDTVRSAGFSHVHFNLGWRSEKPFSEEEAASWRNDLDAAGVRVLDVHGCHPRGVNLWDEDTAIRSRALAVNRERLNLTRALGGDAMVYHVPTKVQATSTMIGHLIDGLQRLEDQARQLGIVIALENHYLAENDKRALAACFERFDSEYIGFTLDVGHGLLSSNLDWLLDHCIERLTVLHLNDNEGEKDRHWLPYDGAADWDTIARSIASSPYGKPLQLEVRWYEGRHPTYEAFLIDAKQRAARLQEQIDAYRRARSAS